MHATETIVEPYEMFSERRIFKNTVKLMKNNVILEGHMHLCQVNDHAPSQVLAPHSYTASFFFFNSIFLSFTKDAKGTTKAAVNRGPTATHSADLEHFLSTEALIM